MYVLQQVEAGAALDLSHVPGLLVGGWLEMDLLVGGWLEMELLVGG